jgi:hypothetical protein
MAGRSFPKHCLCTRLSPLLVSKSGQHGAKQNAELGILTQAV